MSDLREWMVLHLTGSQPGHQMAGPPEYLTDLEESDIRIVGSRDLCYTIRGQG
jgi:hypothetical protein